LLAVVVVELLAVEAVLADSAQAPDYPLLPELITQLPLAAVALAQTAHLAPLCAEHLVVIQYSAPLPQLAVAVAVAHLQLLDSAEVLAAAAAVVEMAHHRAAQAAQGIPQVPPHLKAATVAVEVRR